MQSRFESDEQRDLLVQDFLATGFWSGEIVQLHRHGSELHLLASITLLKDEIGPFGVIAIIGDVTERKEQERQLRYYASLQENVRDAVISHDLEFHIQTWNLAAQRIYGWQSEEVIGKTTAEVLHTHFESEELRQQAMDELFREGHWQAETTQQHKDGTLIHIQISLVLLKDGYGKPYGIVAVNHDITKRKKAEQELQAKIVQEREFQKYLEALPKITIELMKIDSLDGLYKRAVELGREHLGFERLGLWLYDAEHALALGTYGVDIMGNLVDERHLQADPAEMSSIMMQSLTIQDRFVFVEQVPLYTSLEPVGFGWNAVAVLWNGEQNLGWLSIDNGVQHKPISQALLDILTIYSLKLGSLIALKQEQIALRESESLYRLVAENITDLIARYDPDGRFLYVSPSCRTMLGYEPEELLGHLAMEFVHLDDVWALRNMYAIAVKEHRVLLSIICRYRHKQGHYVWIESGGRAIYSENTNEIVEIVTSARDITQRIKDEEALQKAFNLEKELGELKSRFVEMASHEFRNPLAAILSSSGMLARYRDRMDASQINQKLDGIGEQVKHLTDIIDDVLNLGRLQSAYSDFRPVEMDFDGFCREIVSEYQSQVEMTHQFVYTSESIQAMLNMDKKLMREVITNLISNAIKYSPADSSVFINLEHIGDSINLSVRDEGIGIPAADLRHLFEPFHRAGNVGRISGTGLGLSITKQAVELHGGDITVKSEVNIGTTFLVSIPTA